MRADKNRVRAAWNLGRDVVRRAAFALAGSPPQLSVICASAALGFALDLLATRRAAGINLAPCIGVRDASNHMYRS